MQSLTRLTIFLTLTWIITLLYGEMFTYLLVSFFSCSFPKPQPNNSVVMDQVKVAVMSDVQLLDRTSFASEAVKFYSDVYMRRAFRMSVLSFRPDVVVFLGDQFDGGAELNDQEWQESVSRFKHIFGLNNERRKSDISVYHLSGNRDIGYSVSHSQSSQVTSRYEKEFGARNYNFSAGTVDFVVVDGQTLDRPSKGAETSLSWEFIKNMSNVTTSKPRVLLTHIPLFRANETSCGRYHSFPIINQRDLDADPDHGTRYQSYLSEETSNRLLNLTRPILVLSGHDHDQCTVIHSTPFGPVEEQTLGTFNWLQGNHYPSFMLLTVTLPSNNTSSTNLVSTRLCFLPMQTHIYVWYLCQFIMMLTLLTIWPTNGFGCCDRIIKCINSIKAFGRSLIVPSKEKNDEENCDYEMIWDAEGAMHLVKKAAPHVSNVKSDVGSVRGNAAIRQSVKKNIVPEAEAIVSLDMSTVKVLRVSKSKTRVVIQRLIRVLQLLIIITAVNFPLYMMLLFKDWIDR